MKKKNETCQKCREFAGIDNFPEGERCGICKDWVCQECIDYYVSSREYKLFDGQLISKDTVCKSCSKELGLQKMSPIENFCSSSLKTV